MTERATKRPDGFVKPDHWNDAPPPAPAKPDASERSGDGDHETEEGDGTVSPTRYGDWVKDGVAIDF